MYEAGTHQISAVSDDFYSDSIVSDTKSDSDIYSTESGTFAHVFNRDGFVVIDETPISLLRSVLAYADEYNLHIEDSSLESMYEELFSYNKAR